MLFRSEEFAQKVDPHGRPYYWLTGKYHNEEPDNMQTDLSLNENGYVSVVPCRPDQTLYSQVEMLDKWFDK